MIMRTVVLIAALASAGSSALFLARLRKEHTDVWRSLGSPSFFPFPFGKRMDPYRSFIFSPAVSRLGDPYLVMLPKVMSVSGLIAFVVLVLGMLLRWRI